MKQSYENNGFIRVKSFLSQAELTSLTHAVDKFHSAWLRENQSFYQERAINSAYLTSKQHLADADRETLFQVAASDKIAAMLASLPIKRPAFMNTQLFFDPANPARKNYWHRDSQYHLSIEEQKQALSGPEVIHFRIALKDEPGIELIPGSHRQWDTSESLAIRLEQQNKTSDMPIDGSVVLPLQKGDLLVFSANMIHRGLYGMNRMALDIIYCEALPDLLQFVDLSCLPSKSQLKRLDYPIFFENTMDVAETTTMT